MNSNINDIIIERNLSKYKLSKESGVPYMTLNDICSGKTDPGKCSAATIYRLACALNTSMEVLIGEKPAGVPAVPARNWAETRKKRYHFPILPGCETVSFDIARIHPLKQRSIKKIHEILSCDRRVAGAVVFGSSCGIRCGRGSDIDLCIELNDVSNEVKNEVSEAVQEACGFDADILWADRIKAGTAIDNNIKMGVNLI